MTNKVFYGIAIALVLSAAALGYLLMKPQGAQAPVATNDQGSKQVEGSFNPETQAPQGAELPNASAQQVTPPTATTSIPDAADYKNPKVIEALSPLSPTATQADQIARQKLVESLAKEVVDVHVGGDCRMGPPIIRTQLGSTINFINGDVSSHTIIVDGDHHWDIKPGAKVPVKIDFGKGAGVYGYSCDNHSNALGIMLVTTSKPN